MRTLEAETTKAPLMRLVSSAAFCAAMDTTPAISCSVLAERVGCSKSLIGHMRVGAVRSTNRMLAAAIESAVGVPIGSLFQ